MKYEGILLDLDNTVYLYDEVHQIALKKTYSFLHSRGLFEDFKDFNKSYKEAQAVVKSNTKNQAASHNRLLYFQILLEDLNVMDSELMLNTYSIYWDSFLEEMEMIPEFEELLNISEKQNIPIVIVTDLTAHIQHRKIVSLGLNKRIKAIVTSEEAGCEKPSSKIFHIALNKIGIPAKKVMFIGDNFKKDIEGALKAGISPFWFSPENKDIKGIVDAGEYFQFNSYRSLCEFIR